MSRAMRMAAVAAAGVGVYVTVARRRQLTWGATREEAVASLPGDDVVSPADLVATRCIDIEAAPERVWPWIAQLGQGRGGFYSYDVLENLVGCDIHSAETIVPEWQRVEVGDEVKLHPEVALTVAMAEPGLVLLLRGGVPVGGTQGQPPYDFSWAFVVRERPGGAARLLVRERYRYTRRWAGAMVEPAAAVSFVMSRKMLTGIKRRAERG